MIRGLREWYGWVVLTSALATCAVGAEAGASAAASPQEERWVTLDALLDEALRQNPELRFYTAELEAARAGRRIAARPAPAELSGEVGRKTVRAAGLREEGLAWSVALMQPFEWPGRIRLRKAIADREIELAELGIDTFRTTLAGRIRAAAYSVIAAREGARATRKVVERISELREVLVQRDPAGLTPLLEIRLIEATELTLRRTLEASELSQRQALIDLNHLRAAPLDAEVAIHTPEFQYAPLPDIESLQAIALTNNFLLRHREVELRQQGFKVQLARNERRPTISLGPVFSQETAGDRERMVGVGVSLPIPLWSGSRGSVEAARARQDQAEALVVTEQREIHRRIAVARMGYMSKTREIQSWTPDTLIRLEEAADLADRHYRLGAVAMPAYVEIQKGYLEAIESLLALRREALEAAAELEQLTGRTWMKVKREPPTEPTP